MTDNTLPFTGERFTPECVREISYEHWHRYTFARALAKGKRVLDAACGEGYGSAQLAQVAAEVTGVDIDAETIAHARSRYGAHPKLRYMQSDVTLLDTLPHRSFDLIVSFETLEHVQAQERLLDDFARLLSDDGVLLVSTPDKLHYNAGGEPNPFHVRELLREEFEALLAARFPARRLYAQKLLFQSAIWSLDGGAGGAQASVQDGEILRDGMAYPPLYYVAACARTAAALKKLPALSLYGDAQESVYAHYNAEVRKSIAAGMRIAALEAQIETLKRAVRGRRE
jgi:SAM-dependent methyltransferase